MDRFQSIRRRYDDAYSQQQNVGPFAGVIILCLALAWLVYLFFGHELIGSIHNSESTSLIGRMMPHRATTALEAYYKRADELMILLSFWTVAALAMASIVTFVLRQPVGALMVFCSLMLTSLMFLPYSSCFRRRSYGLVWIALITSPGKVAAYADPTMTFRYGRSWIN